MRTSRPRGRGGARRPRRAWPTHLGFPVGDVEEPVALDAVRLRAPRVLAPAPLARRSVSDDAHARASHALGKSYSDVVRGFRGDFRPPAGLRGLPARGVTTSSGCSNGARPSGWRSMPYGGGTSVVGGVEPHVGSGLCGRRLARSFVARSRARGGRGLARGAHPGRRVGSGLEAQLAAHGLTLRHFPQSFELSHARRLDRHPRRRALRDACGRTSRTSSSRCARSRRTASGSRGACPDRAPALRPIGCSSARRAPWVSSPRRGCGCSLGRRTAPRRGCASAAFIAGAECVRALSQSGLHPSNCRLIDPAEAPSTFAGDGTFALLVLGFESADHAVDALLDRALAICAEHGGAAGERR